MTKKSSTKQANHFNTDITIRRSLSLYSNRKLISRKKFAFTFIWSILIDTDEDTKSPKIITTKALPEISGMRTVDHNIANLG